MSEQTAGQPAIHGYRNLTDDQIALINEGKVLAEMVGAYVERLRLMDGPDLRWVSIGATSLQQGFMALVRSIAQPTTF